ncbi:polysaccharide biosynthesis/export family protein [Microvirga terricola]|uniref:Polysaccharide export outer membrane protein n=1 Tax=Microvirga terricola TaxID=2719797 RepID=A0ABX0VFT0_9HYPH|nr:polysaccharide biosynthesis/export family protein [Microvirga terricola]NIX78081.1 hypothetical protein [Microvirga terricola]
MSLIQHIFSNTPRPGKMVVKAMRARAHICHEGMRIMSEGERVRKLSRGLLHLIALSIVCLLPAVPTLASEYRLDVGDVLELSIMGSPEVRQRIPIDLNGDASFPLIGEMQVVGMSLPELRSRVGERLPNFVYKNRSISSGGDAAQIIEPHEISLRILEYRPVYLNGDIARQGEIAYRPGLTIRQAISIAGGYNIMGSTAGNSLLEVLELQKQRTTLAINFAKESARVWRLQNVLGRQSVLNRNELLANLNPEVVNQIIDLEAEHLKTALNDYEVEKANLLNTIAQAKQRIENLLAQAKSEEEGAKLDAEDMERVNELFKKSLVPASRVTDVRRTVLLSLSRAQQTNAAADNAKKDRDEADAKLQRLLLIRRIEAAREMEEANARVESLRGELDTIKKKVLLAGSTTTSLLKARNANMHIWIFRKNDRDRSRIVAEEDTELVPGDVVEVSLGLSDSVGVPQALDVPK